MRIPPTNLDLTHWGVEMARKGGVPADRVLNCLDLTAIRNYLQQRRSGSASRLGVLSRAGPVGLLARLIHEE